ncbi:MAG: M28 family peptidase [Sulfuricaulis sp.]|uniref:M28 family peptidase n=1 Tax=Sulfuricaulis sp. TaxID=2003553 RepID=UPI0034A4E647
MTLRSAGAIIVLWLMLAVTIFTSTMAASISETSLRTHVQTLAGDIGERNVLKPQALRAAADYVRRQWESYGYQVIEHEYKLENDRWANLEVILPGRLVPNEIVVIGAHYDSVFGSPGANDNGSGVAALLELSRLFAARDTERTVRFVAFVNEEPPFFRTGAMGSRHYARGARARGEDIRAMLALETIGYYDDKPGSQNYPPLFAPFFPDRGNFIGLVSNFRSRALLKQVVAAFRAASDFPLEYVSTFGWVPGVDWSDHGSFWSEGYPAIMVTDTALYRYPYYHSEQDTPDKVDYARLARVTAALAAVVEALAQAGEAP